MSPDPDEPSASGPPERHLDSDEPPAGEPAQRRRRWRVLRNVLLVVGALLIAGIAFSILQATVRSVDDEEFTAAVVESADLEVDDGGIDVRVREEPGAERSMAVEARVRYFLRRPAVDFEDGSEARLRTSCGWPSNCDIDVSASVPRGSDVTTRTGSGHLLVVGPAGVVDARALDGSVTVVGAQRDVRAAVGNGTLSVRSVAGAVRAEVTSGELELSRVTGALRVRTGEGGVSATALGASDAEIESGTGNVDVAFTETPERVEIDVGAGNLVLEVPRGAYRLDTELGAGSLDVEGITEDPDAAERITIRSGQGNVSVIGR